MFEHLADLETELEKLESQLPELYASGDQAAARDAGRRHAELRPLVDVFREYRRTEADVSDARELLAAEQDPEMREYLQGELAEREARLAELEATLKELLIPRDPNDSKNVIVEIRGAEGGDEANLWAGSLFEMYRRYAELRGWDVEVLSSQPAEIGGYRDMTFVVKGRGAWSRLKHEAGPHRVQRVPATESQGRVHTSAATVAVLPEAEAVDIEIDPNDLEVDVYRSSGPGGQSVNPTDSAVRITHKPTGLVVTCQNEKSQLQNKEQAMKILKSRLLEREVRERAEQEGALRQAQVGTGDRSAKVRTYNFPQGRITDHRVGVTSHNLEATLGGDLEEFTQALAAKERADKLAAEAAGTPG